MGFCADIVTPDSDGQITISFFESEIDPRYKKLYKKYKDILIVSQEVAYDVHSANKLAREQYDVNMTSGDVYEDGWPIWVRDQDEPILLPLSFVPSKLETRYTLKVSVVSCITSEPKKYNAWIRKKDKTFVVSPKEWKKALSFFPKKDIIQNLNTSELIIYNSF